MEKKETLHRVTSSGRRREEEEGIRRTRRTRERTTTTEVDPGPYTELGSLFLSETDDVDSVNASITIRMMMKILIS